MNSLCLQRFSDFISALQGFRKLVPDRWEFSNDCFRRGEKNLLCDIQRRKVTTPSGPVAAIPAVTVAAVPVPPPPPPPPPMVSPTDSGEEQVVSSTSSPAPVQDPVAAPGCNSELLGENERLRQENQQLNKELSQLKNMCGNIYVLMSDYSSNNNSSTANNNDNNEFVAEGSNNNESAVEDGSPGLKALDLFTLKSICDEESGAIAECGEVDLMALDDDNARLFGVAIGMKRGREKGTTSATPEGMEEEHHHPDQELQLQQPGTNVKSEPSSNEGSSSGDDDQETAWLRHCHMQNQRMCN